MDITDFIDSISDSSFIRHEKQSQARVEGHTYPGNFDVKESE